MADIVTLDAPMRDETQAPRRLKAMSKGLSLLFLLMLGLVVVALAGGIIMLLFFPQYLVSTATGVGAWFGPQGTLPPLKPGMTRMSDQPLITHVTGAVDWAIGLAPVFFVFWNLRKLFRLYAEGIVFAPSNAAHLKQIGFWLILYPFTKFIANTVFRLGGGVDHAWFHASELEGVVLGLIVTAIAQVMEFGRAIEQEKDSFI